LLNKLYKYGVRGICFDWFNSYLSNRKQNVIYNDVTSNVQNITCGVPQGSILGPLLFLLYVNDLANASNVLFAILFADDTNLFFNGKTLSEIIKTVNDELKNVFKWLNANKLSLNIKKTHFIVFSTARKRTCTDDNLYINGKRIQRVESTKFLGILLDSNLSWSEHIQYIKCKISKGIGILCKARKKFKLETLITIYYSFIYPYLTYCIEIWGKASDRYISSIFKLQKRAIRIISSTNYMSHTAPLFHKHDILPLHKIYIYHVTLFMFNFDKEKLPDIFNELFIRNKDVHTYSTRQSEQLHVPKANLSTYQRCIKYVGVIIWNFIMRQLNTDCSLVTYKYKLKHYLLCNDMHIMGL
jgi:hypothetical protein